MFIIACDSCGKKECVMPKKWRVWSFGTLDVEMKEKEKKRLIKELESWELVDGGILLCKKCYTNLEKELKLRFTKGQ